MVNNILKIQINKNEKKLVSISIIHVFMMTQLKS